MNRHPDDEEPKGFKGNVESEGEPSFEKKIYADPEQIFRATGSNEGLFRSLFFVFFHFPAVLQLLHGGKQDDFLD